MELNPLNLQKKFALFAVGDVEDAKVISFDNDFINLKTSGGCFGQMSIVWSEKLNLQPGAVINVVVSEINDGLPLFVPSDAEVLKFPQPAVVKQAAPRGVIVVFEYKNLLGIYAVSEQMPLFKENQKVIASGIHQVNDPDGSYFRIDRLNLVMEETSPVTENAAPKPKPKAAEWTNDQFQNAVNRGSLPEKDGLKLGRIYLAQVVNDKKVLLSNNCTASVGKLPLNATDYVFVRISFISAQKNITSQFVRIAAPEETASFVLKKTGKNKLSKLNGIDFRKRDDSVFAEGVKQGSDRRLEGYWLGFHYRVPIVDGLPFLADGHQGSFKVKLDQQCISASSGDIVYIVVTHIKNRVITVKIKHNENN